MDGLMLGALIKADPRIAGVPLVMLSSLALRAYAEKAAAQGFAAYLTKPARQHTLYSTISRVLAGDAVVAEVAPADAPEAPPAAAATTNPDASRKKLLIAEDNLVNQKVAVLAISKMGYETSVVPDGRQAVDAFVSGSFDAILMDCQMPEMDGYEAAAEIRRLEQGRQRIPIVAMTAHAMKGDREKCLSAGMDDYVSKPLKVAELQAILARLVGSAPAAPVPACDAPPEQPTEARPTEAPPPLDLGVLRTLRSYGAEGGPDPVADLTEAFMVDARDRLSRIRAACAIGDESATRKAAHSLKGMSGAIGANHMSALSGALEHAEPGTIDGARIEQLEREFQRVAGALLAV
jgi:CheY-like chemotaxis protein/HPt (histidine-containing phosphotransfer) domain-containing protein